MAIPAARKCPVTDGFYNHDVRYSTFVSGLINQYTGWSRTGEDVEEIIQSILEEEQSFTFAMMCADGWIPSLKQRAVELKLQEILPQYRCTRRCLGLGALGFTAVAAMAAVVAFACIGQKGKCCGNPNAY